MGAPDFDDDEGPDFDFDLFSTQAIDETGTTGPMGLVHSSTVSVVLTEGMAPAGD